MPEGKFLDDLRRQAGVTVAASSSATRVSLTSIASSGVAGAPTALQGEVRKFLTWLVVLGAPLAVANLMLVDRLPDLSDSGATQARVADFAVGLLSWPAPGVQAWAIGIMGGVVLVLGIVTKWFSSVGSTTALVLQGAVWVGTVVYAPTFVTAVVLVVVLVVMIAIVVAFTILFFWLMFSIASS